MMVVIINYVGNILSQKYNIFKMDLQIQNILKHLKDIDTIIIIIYHLIQEQHKDFQNLMDMTHQQNGYYRMVIYITHTQHQKKDIMLYLMVKEGQNILTLQELQQQQVQKFGRQLLYQRYCQIIQKRKEMNQKILYNIQW